MTQPKSTWETAYREHRTAVYQTALSYLKDPHAAEDVLQDVFLRLHGTLEKGERIRHLRAWLLTVTRNRCADVRSLTRREYPAEDTDAVWDIPVEDDDAVFVRDALATLSDEERIAFCLHCLDGWSYRELAEGLGIPMGTVQTRVRAARRRLRLIIKEGSQ